MREIVFRVRSDRPDQLEATAEGRPITITAATLEDLHHEAREALIHHLGPAHHTYRVRLRQPQAGLRPAGTASAAASRPPLRRGGRRVSLQRSAAARRPHDGNRRGKPPLP